MFGSLIFVACSFVSINCQGEGCLTFSCVNSLRSFCNNSTINYTGYFTMN